MFLLLAAAFPGMARAGTASTQDRGNSLHGFSRSVTFKAGPGERNTVTVSQEGDTIVLNDSGAPIAVAGECVKVDEHTARCKAGSGAQAANVETGDGDDSILLAEGLGTYTEGRGGPGDDVLTTMAQHGLFGDDGDDELTGSSFRDHLWGGRGNDRLLGGDGDDYLVGDDTFAGAPSPRGRDAIDGGPGIDMASYGGHRVPVDVDLARVGGQGARGEGDSLEGIEQVTGGRARDELRGDGGRNYLVGDNEYAAGGASGGDTISGRGGGDLLVGSHGADRISGGDGDDRLHLGRGRDRVSGGAGDDHVELGRDDRETAPASPVACGAGTDMVTSPGARNVVARDCEAVAIPFGEVAWTRVRAGATQVEVPVAWRHGEFATSYGPACGAKVELSARYRGRRRPLGSGAGGLPGDGSANVIRAKLNTLGRRLLAAPGPARIRVTVRTHHACSPGETRVRNAPASFAVDL